jgi:SAM-dependent methyltransferase
MKTVIADSDRKVVDRVHAQTLHQSHPRLVDRVPTLAENISWVEGGLSSLRRSRLWRMVGPAGKHHTGVGDAFYRLVQVARNGRRNIVTRESLSRTKADFYARMDVARKIVADKRYLERKWLRDSRDLWATYHREFIHLNPPHGSDLLDLGAGGGYLMWLCRELAGCAVTGVDPAERVDYEALRTVFDLAGAIEKRTIEARTPLRLARRYDVICATRICFNRRGDALWEEADYTYFLRDAAQHLNPGGELYLHFNEPPPAPVFDTFRRLGMWEGTKKFRFREGSTVLPS